MLSFGRLIAIFRSSRQEGTSLRSGPDPLEKVEPKGTNGLYLKKQLVEKNTKNI